MTSYVLKINERLMPGKTLLNYLKSLSKTSDYVDIVPEKERPYNKEFVKEILESRESEGVKIKLEDLWK